MSERDAAVCGIIVMVPTQNKFYKQRDHFSICGDFWIACVKYITGALCFYWLPIVEL